MVVEYRLTCVLELADLGREKSEELLGKWFIYISYVLGE